MKLKKLIAFTIFALGFSSLAYSAGIVTKSTQAVGTGLTRPDAVQSALEDALAQLKGVQLSSQTSVRQLAQTETSKDSTEFASLEQTRKETRTKVEGRVKSYSVISEKRLEDGSIEVVADVDVTFYEPGPASMRRKIVVLPFAYKGTAQYVGDYDKRLRQGIVDSLTSSRRFAILDKDFDNSRMNEMASLFRQDVVPEERAKYGNTLGADYILVEDINNFDVKTKTSVDPYLKSQTTSTRGHMSYTWRLIELATGQILASRTVDLPLRLRKSEDLYASAGQEGQKVGVQITEQIFPLMVLAVNGNEATIGQGGETLKVGSRYNLVRLGRMLKDPYTGEPLGRDEMKVGLVEISDVSPKISHATILKSDRDLNGAGSCEFLLRAVETKAGSGNGQSAPPKRSTGPKW